MKLKNILFYLLIAFLIFIITSGCDSKGITLSKKSKQPEAENNTEITLYFMKSTDTSFIMEKEKRMIEGPVTPEKVAAELLKGPESENLTRIIPEGTKVLGMEIQDGVLYLDLSKDIMHGNYGSEGESILINTIVWTFTELPEINKVQILVEGKKIESIGGHIVISEPLSR